MNTKKDIKDYRILITSDSKHFIKTVRQSLTVCGIKNVSEVETAARAISELKLRIPDVMIVSYSFKPKDGIEFSRFIRRNPQSPAKYIPIIMANEFSDKSLLKKAINAGINELLLMPFSPKNVLSKIRYVLEKPRPFVESQDYFGPDRRRRDDPNFKGPDRRKKAGMMTPEQIEALLKKK